MRQKKRNPFNVLYTICILLIGLAIAIYGFLGEGNSYDYVFGFGVGMSLVAIASLARYFILSIHPNQLLLKQIEYQDERNVLITTKSYALTFRICIFVEAITSIICALIHEVNISMLVALAILGQLLVYLISRFIISRQI